MGFLPTILIERYGLSAAAAAVLGAGAVAANIVGNVAAGLLLHRGVPRWALIALAGAGMGLSALGIFSGALPFAVVYGLCVLFAAVGGLLPASVLGAAADHAPAPHLVAPTSGLLVQGSNLGQVIGPPAIGAVASLTGGWAASPLVLTSGAAVAVGLALVLRGIEGRRAGAARTRPLRHAE
jgi:MFS family permease